MSLEDIHMNTQDLLEKKQLDAGGFGTISLCFHKKHGYVVLKKVYTGPQRTEYNASLLEEGKIMRRLQHDRVVKLLGIILEDGNYSLVMEYVDRGNMMKVLQKLPLPLSVKGRFVLEIAEGMLYLHEQGFVHKDLKPENILVDRDFHIKIADLGVASFKNWSRLTQEETVRQKQIKSTFQNNAGTLFYMAPEHLSSLNVKPVEKSDVYSFGIVIWAIFADKEPYEHGINETQICFGIMNGNRPDIKEITDKCPVEIIDLMKQCWDKESEKRPTFAEISERYKPFYYQNLGKNIEDDLKKLKKTWPESNELLNRMQSLQIDAVSEDASNSQVDQPNSLHSSQGPMTSQINEALFAASPENQPVESCETSFTPADNLESKLQCEYNYHVFGSRMDKAIPPIVYTPEMREEERRRRVSYDPYVKPSPTPQWNELYPRAEKTGSNTNPYFWPQPAATALKQGNVDVFRGPNPNSLLTGNTEGLYGLHSANTFSLSKPPVPESGLNLQSQTNANWYPKNADTDTGRKVLIVYAHQEPKSLNGSLKRVAVEELSKQGCSVTVSDLYAMHFEPRATRNDIVGCLHNSEEFNYGVETWEAYKRGGLSNDLIEEQKKVQEADLLIFQFPLYWFSMPAIMKGWMDRVLVQGFAHKFPNCYDSGLLKDKLALFSFTTGGSREMYAKGGISGDIRYVLWPMQHGIMHFCGVKVLAPHICFAPEYVSEEKRKEMLIAWAHRLKTLWKEEPINCSPEWYFK